MGEFCLQLLVILELFLIWLLVYIQKYLWDHLIILHVGIGVEFLFSMCKGAIRSIFAIASGDIPMLAELSYLDMNEYSCNWQSWG